MKIKKKTKLQVLKPAATIPSDYVAAWTLTIKFSYRTVIFQSFYVETPFNPSSI